MLDQIPDPIIITKQKGDIRFHTFISSFVGDHIADSTHIIESQHQLVLVDAQFLAPYARQFRKYADSLDKPIEKLFLTHRHPDHWFGIGTAFDDIPIYALPETILFLQEKGQHSIDDHAHLNTGAPEQLTPDQLIIPQNTVTLGEDTIDGVSYIFKVAKDTEIDFHLIIELPELKVCIVQDLIYSGTHLYLTKDKDMQNWIKFLKEMAVSRYEWFLPGHGWPCDKVEVGKNIEYLTAARQVVNDNKYDFKSFLLERYPNRLCPKIFDIYLPRLFDGAPDS